MLTSENIASLVSPATEYLTLPGAFELESGAVLTDVRLAYRTWGRLNASGDNAVLVCHALTGSADADDWWPGLIGPGKALDPDSDFIVCSNVLGSCYGSSGPLAQRPGTDGRYGGDFPAVTVRDMVRAQRQLLTALKVEQLQLVLGPSLGGMQTLEWAASFPDFVRTFAPIGVSGRHSAWCIATSEAQRQAIFADPNWHGGHYDPSRPPAQGLAAARMMAMVSYRSWDNFEERFGRARQDESAGELFTVQSYLRHQGAKINQRFDAVSYVRLTDAMDTHDLARGRGAYADVLAQLPQPALVVAVTSDVLYPPHEQQELVDKLPNARYAELDSAHGHDGFLIDIEPLADLLTRFRRDAGKSKTAISAAG